MTLVDGTRLEVTEVAVESLELPVGFRPAGAALGVGVADGVVVEPATVAIAGEEPPTGSIPIVLHLNDVGWWEPNVAEYSGGVYRVEATAFSLWTAGWVVDVGGWVEDRYQDASGFVGDRADDVVDWVSGRTDFPEGCGDYSDDPYGWVDLIADPPDGTFHICTSANPPVDGVERVEVKVKSNRSVPMWLVIPSFEYDYLWSETSLWGPVGPVLLALDGGADNRVLLAPGRTLTIGYRQPRGAGIELQFSTYEDNVTQLSAVMTELVGELAIVGTTLAMANCFLEMDDIGDGRVTFADASWSMLLDCAAAMKDVTESQMVSNLAVLVEGGRLGLSEGETEEFMEVAVEAGRVKDLLRKFRKITAYVALAEAAKDAWFDVADQIVAATPGLNNASVWITGRNEDEPEPQATPAPQETVVEEYVTVEGLDLESRSVAVANWVGVVDGDGEFSTRPAEPPTERFPIDDNFEVLRVRQGQPVTDVAAYADWVNSNGDDTPATMVFTDDGERVLAVAPYTAGGTGEGIDWDYCWQFADPTIDELGDCDSVSAQPTVDGAEPTAPGPNSAVDAFNGSLPPGTCDQHDTVIELVDGYGPLDGNQSAVWINDELVASGELNGDGVADVAYATLCAVSPSNVVFDLIIEMSNGQNFRLGQEELASDADIPTGGWLDLISSVSIIDDKVEVTWLANNGMEPMCCPSVEGRSAIAVRSDTIIATNSS